MNRPNAKALRKEMRRLREKQGWSQREVARRLDISGEAYRKKELGELGIAGPELARLARLYGLTITQAFPSYTPTEAERMLAEDLDGAA